jgi:anti-sigma B factor antagonist
MAQDASVTVLFEATPGDEGVLRAQVRGDIDPVSARVLAEELGRAIEARRPKQLVVDLSGVEFMDSSGVRVLIEVHRAQDERGASLVLEDLSGGPQRVLEVTGLTDYFDIR